MREQRDVADLERMRLLLPLRERLGEDSKQRADLRKRALLGVAKLERHMRLELLEEFLQLRAWRQFFEILIILQAVSV